MFIAASLFSLKSQVEGTNENTLLNVETCSITSLPSLTCGTLIWNLKGKAPFSYISSPLLYLTDEDTLLPVYPVKKDSG